jgi:hypothetical protein
MKSGWAQRGIAAAAYGAAMYVLTETLVNPVYSTHAVIWVPK